MKVRGIMDTDLLNRIRSGVEAAREELANLLQRLIRIRSYSGEEAEIVEFILDTMQYYGFDEQYSDALGNAIGRIGDGPIKILYDGHIDTVQVTDEESWTYPPFEGRIVDGSIYGRGAVDEKSAVAGFLMLAPRLKGKTVAIVICGRNIDANLFARIVCA